MILLLCIIYLFFFIHESVFNCNFFSRQWKQTAIVVVAKKKNVVERYNFTTEGL